MRPKSAFVAASLTYNELERLQAYLWNNRTEVALIFPQHTTHLGTFPTWARSQNELICSRICAYPQTLDQRNLKELSRDSDSPQAHPGGTLTHLWWDKIHHDWWPPFDGHHRVSDSTSKRVFECVSITLRRFAREVRQLASLYVDTCAHGRHGFKLQVDSLIQAVHMDDVMIPWVSWVY